MSDFWRRYLCPIGLHWRRYVDTGHFKGFLPELHHVRCRFCERDFYFETGRI